MKRRPTGKQTNKKLANTKGLQKEKDDENRFDDVNNNNNNAQIKRKSNSPVPSLHQDEEKIETVDQDKLLAEDVSKNTVTTFKSEETLTSSSSSSSTAAALAKQLNSNETFEQSSNPSQNDHHRKSSSVSTSPSSRSSNNKNDNDDRSSSEASIKSASKTKSPFPSRSSSTAGNDDEEHNRDDASLASSDESERNDVNNNAHERQDDIPLEEISNAYDNEDSDESDDDDNENKNETLTSPSVPLSQNAKNLEYRREQQFELAKSKTQTKTNRRTRSNNKLSKSNINNKTKNENEGAEDNENQDDDDEDDLDEEEILFRQNYLPGSINDARRMRTLMLSSQMKNFDDGLNPCFKRILGFSYEGFVDFADVFRGANVTSSSATTTTTANNNQQNNNNNKQSANHNNNNNLNEDPAGLSRSASRRRQREPTNNPKSNGDDASELANILNKSHNNSNQQNIFTTTNINTSNFERDSHQHSFPENRMKFTTVNKNMADSASTCFFSKNLFDENEEEEEDTNKKINHVTDKNNLYHKNHNTGLLRCYEPQVANKRRSGLQQFFSVVATSGGAGPHTRVSALGTCEDLVEYSEIRLSLLCECLRHFETFGCFTGLPDRCRVALHFVVCEERELPWNDASGVPLIVSKAADVRLWCLETLSSLIHSTFSILATNSLISRAATRAIFDDVFLVEGDPNALFSAQFFAAVSKYSTLRAAKLLKASLIENNNSNMQKRKNRSNNINKNPEQIQQILQFDPEHSVLKIDTFNARGIMNSLAQTVLDNPFYDNNSHNDKDRSLVRALELLMNSVIAKIESELANENVAADDDDENTKSSEKNKPRIASSLCDLFVSKEPVQQILLILKAGSEFVKRELFPLFISSHEDGDTSFPHHWMPSATTSSQGENLVDSVFNEELEKQQGGHDTSANDSSLHYKCDKFSDFLNVSYDTFDDDENNNIPPKVETEDDEFDAISRFANLLPHVKDPDVLFNLQRILSVNNGNKTATNKNSLLQVAIPSTMITPISILLDLSSRLSQSYQEMGFFSSTNTNTNKNKNHFDEFISAVMCPLTHMSSIPFVYNRYINSQGQSKTTENQAVESLKLFIHEELKNKIYSADNAFSQLPAPAFACLASVPKLVVELLMIAGRCSLYSTSARSFCLMKNKLKSGQKNSHRDVNNFFSITSTIQSHRLFSSCVKKLQQKIREEFVIKAANEIWNEKKTTLTTHEDAACGNNNESKDDRDRIGKHVGKMFALFEGENNDNNNSTDNRDLAIKNVTGEALFMLARDNRGSDKLLITLWE